MGRVGEIGGDATLANRRLEEIKRARAKNRIILYAVVGALVVAAVIILALKLT